jgi:hypothetical protein
LAADNQIREDSGRDEAGAPSRNPGLGFGAVLAVPIVMRLLFFGVVTPIGVAMRLAGRDPLRRRCDPTASSYWIVRRPPGPSAASMRRQF